MKKLFTILLIGLFYLGTTRGQGSSCATAIDLGTIGSSCPTSGIAAISSTGDARQTANFGTCGNAGLGTWYTFTNGSLPLTMDITGSIVPTSQTTNPRFQIYSGSCASLSSEGTCRSTNGNYNGLVTSFSADANTQYWIYIAPSRNSGSTVSMTINSFSTTNFSSTTAAGIPLGSTAFGCLAESDGTGAFATNACEVAYNYELWYEITIPSGSCTDAIIDVANYTGTGDLAISILHYCSSNTTYYTQGESCSPAAGGIGQAISLANYNSSSTISHYVIISSTTNDGTFDVTYTSSSNPINTADGSSCSSPYVLTLGDGIGDTAGEAHSTSNKCAGVGSEDGTLSTSCSSGSDYVGTTPNSFTANSTCSPTLENTQYFKFQVPTSDTYNVFIGNQNCASGAGIQFLLATDVNCATSPASSGTALGCSSTSSLDNQEINAISLTAGVDYYIITDGFGGDVCDYDIIITSKITSPLPVELINFSGTDEKDVNVLDWSTASEENNSHFEIERSMDGSEFKLLDVIEGNGTTMETNNYTYYDKNPELNSYYRLKQIDFDGSFSYSKIINIKRIGEDVIVNDIRPSPTRGNAAIRLISYIDTEIEVRIIDIAGRIMSIQNVMIEKGSNEVFLDLSAYSNGMYFVSLNSGNVNAIKRIIKR